jgi:hypothetical protein
MSELHIGDVEVYDDFLDESVYSLKEAWEGYCGRKLDTDELADLHACLDKFFYDKRFDDNEPASSEP